MLSLQEGEVVETQLVAPAPEDGQAVVGRGVVDDDELEVGIGRVLEQALEREIEDALVVPVGEQEAHGRVRHRANSNPGLSSSSMVRMVSSWRAKA